jgi:hypothetical protein
VGAEHQPDPTGPVLDPRSTRNNRTYRTQPLYRGVVRVWFLSLAGIDQVDPSDLAEFLTKPDREDASAL